MPNCSDNTYVIRYTDSENGTITIGKSAIITDELDIALVGKTRREYGQIFNENVLHLLEKFACPEDAADPGNPDLEAAYGELLERPVQGQLWNNSTQKRPYVYDGSNWIPLGTLDDVGGNHGVIAHGEQLPRPVSPITGYEFTYAECSWTVSPFNIDGGIDYMRCLTDPASSEVTMEYRIAGESTLREGYVNYQIIGIRGNNNLGVVYAAEPPPTPSAVGVTPTPSITPSPGSSVTPTPAATPTPTPTPVSSFFANLFAFEGSNIRAYSMLDSGATSVALWDFAAANPGDTDTTPLAMWVSDSGATKYIAALYNRYFRVLTWDGATLTQVAKVVLSSQNYLNNNYGSESPTDLPNNLTSIAGNISIRAIDFTTYYIFYVSDVGTYSEFIDVGQIEKYEASLQTFKFVKSGAVLTNNPVSFLPRFHTASTFPSLILDRVVNAYDIRLVGSNIKVAAINEDAEVIFQYDNQGSYLGVLATVGDGVSNNTPTNTVVWYDNTQFFRGKTRDISDESHSDYMTFFNQSTESGFDVTTYLIQTASVWGGATTDNIVIADKLPSSDRIISLAKSVSPSDYLNETIMNAAMKILDFDSGALTYMSSAKLTTKLGVDYYLFKTSKLAVQDGSGAVTGLVLYSFDGSDFTYETTLSGLSPTDYAFYLE